VKRLFLAIALVPLFAWLTCWAIAASMTRKAESGAWPERLGTIADAPSHFPDAEQSIAATELTKMTAPLGISITPRNLNPHIPPEEFEGIKKPLGEYVTAALSRTSNDAPPAVVSAYLANHDAELNVIRDHILTAGPITWSVRYRLAEDAPLPNLLGHMSLTKLFVVRALSKKSWDELHAVWLLNRDLWDRPELICVLISLAATRMMNAAAAQMPLPVPQWFAEVQSLDYRHRFAATFQAEAWTHQRISADLLKTSPVWRALIAPWIDMCAADSTERMRLRTTELMSTRSCDLANDPIGRKAVIVARWNTIGKAVVPGIFFAWERLARFRAELEMTRNVLALRGGTTPSSASSCTDGTWIVAPRSIRFSRDIAVTPPATKYPLALRY
jgi:hypothetical protein